MTTQHALPNGAQGIPEGGLRRVILTASGGAFRDWPVEKLKEVRARVRVCVAVCVRVRAACADTDMGGCINVCV